MADITDLDGEAERVAILRQVLGHQTDAAFAADLGITPQRLNNVLGGSGLGKELALMLCRKVPGLTLDWLHRGRKEALPFDLLRRIEAVEASRKGTTPSRSPKRGKEAR